MKALFIVSSSLDALRAKGVEGRILERDEGGFLEKVITLHPFAPRAHVAMLSSGNVVHEVAFGRSSSFRLLAWLYFAWAIVRTVRYARRLILQERIDFVRAQDPYFSGLVGYLASRWPRLPFCISIHADYDSQHALSPGTASPVVFGSRRLAKMLERFLLRRADLVLPISRHTAWAAERDGAPQDRIRIFRHLIDTSAFLTSEDSGHASRPEVPIISVVSRLSREKHILDLVELGRRLKDAGLSFQLVIGGDGSERNELRRRIEAGNLQSVVIMLGAIRPEEVRSLRQRSTLCVCLLDGLSLIEALAAGKPVIGYDIEWHREAIREGVNGCLVPEGDVGALAKAATSILSDKDLAARMGAQSRQIAMSFDREVGVRDHRAIYQELLAIKSRGYGRRLGPVPGEASH
jgi:glycosyltransferase involved in cell wall biosynthesis